MAADTQAHYYSKLFKVDLRVMPVTKRDSLKVSTEVAVSV